MPVVFWKLSTAPVDKIVDKISQKNLDSLVFKITFIAFSKEEAEKKSQILKSCSIYKILSCFGKDDRK